MKKWLLRGIPALVLLAASKFLLQRDAVIFWTWYLMALVMGIVAMPFAGKLFQGFADHGWMFSKILGICAAGFLTWWLVSLKVLKFTSFSCRGVCLACALVCCLYGRFRYEKGEEVYPFARLKLVYLEELLFFAFFLVWTYLAGFHPAAYGTEKFMDYGFMEAMMRSTVLPARDLWYSQGHINYYYGGQYYAVFLTKAFGGTAAVTYNLMRTFVAAFAFSLPFSLVYQMTSDRLGGLVREYRRGLPCAAGFTAGLAVSVAGNMHYVIYGVIRPWIEKIHGAESVSPYWFPDATRYIGFDPDVPDKTIHEFPCYSFVLGDLHAHVVNIMFVLFLIGLLYAWFRETLRSREEEPEGKRLLLKHLRMPQILTAGVLLGIYQWTNYWDFVIYYVVTGGAVVFANIIRFRGKVKKIILVTAAQAVEVMAAAMIVILPFTLQFQSMVQGVAIARNHSMIHQLLVLWGLPVFLTILFLIVVISERRRQLRQKSLFRFMKAISIPDLYAAMLGLCAMGLVLIPELVYVRDIYENGNARANTMFKLTYQAYIMFGIVMGYGIYRLLMISRKKIVKVLAFAGLFCLLWTCGYFGKSVDSWFGSVLNPGEYQGLNATNFLETEFPQDAEAIRWLRGNIQGSPVVLEANGDSYTGYERVSAMTGLPTILGWYVHEWLWRNDVDDVREKSEDVENIYTSEDEELVKDLLEQYEVEYIFVGSMEREKYGDRLNEELLGSLGEEVFRDGASGVYILKMDR